MDVPEVWHEGRRVTRQFVGLVRMDGDAADRRAGAAALAAAFGRHSPSGEGVASAAVDASENLRAIYKATAGGPVVAGEGLVKRGSDGHAPESIDEAFIGVADESAGTTVHHLPGRWKRQREDLDEGVAYYVPEE